MNTNISNNNDNIDIFKKYNDSGNLPTDTPVEDPQKCFVMNDIDDYSTKTISTGEVCTISTAKLYGIFGKNTYFNTNVPYSEQSDINVFIDNSNIKNLNYSLCSVDSKNYAYENCVLTTKNPWKSIDNTNEYCMLPIDVTLPEKLVYNNESKKIDKPQDVPLFKSKKDCCQEKWYDWFSIPDYHIGNKIFLDSSNVKCYAPCEIGTVPNPDSGNDKCISKNNFQYGFYSSSFHYLPISLIMLFGSTKDSLLNKHKRIITQTRAVLNKKGDMTMNFELYNNILTNQVTQDNIYSSIKEDLKQHIRKLLSFPFDQNNIIVPDPDIQTLSSYLMTKENIADAYDIAKNFYDLSTSPDKKIDYDQWKKKLAEISGFSVNDSKFYKQLLILKKACNVTFDGTTSYSKDVVLYVANQDPEPIDPVRNPIKFDITDEDITLAISSNSSENSDRASDLLSSSVVSERRAQLLSEETKKQSEIDDSGLALNLEGTDPSKYDKIQQENVGNNENNEKSSMNWQKTLMVTAFTIIISIFLITLLIIVAKALWPYVSGFLNNVISGFIYIIYYTRDMFRGKYSPSKLNYEILDLQRSFLVKKINNDMNRKY